MDWSERITNSLTETGALMCYLLSIYILLEIPRGHKIEAVENSPDINSIVERIRNNDGVLNIKVSDSDLKQVEQYLKDHPDAEKMLINNFKSIRSIK